LQGTIADLQQAIQDRRVQILLSHDNIESVKADLQSKKKTLQELQLELATLERALSILQGQSRYAPTSHNFELPLNIPRRGSRDRKDTGAVYDLVEDILRVEGRPLSATALLPLVLARRSALGMSPVTREGMTGVLYRFAKKNRTFMYLGAGRFGLLEWQGKGLPGGTGEALRMLP
jgi:hypothetical protein